MKKSNKKKSRTIGSDKLAKSIKRFADRNTKTGEKLVRSVR